MTMRDYRQQTAQATTWRRAHQVLIENPLPGAGTPIIRFMEQDVVQVGERQIATPLPGMPGGIGVAFDPQREFPLLNPQTGEQVGTMTHAQLYAALYSVYMQAAQERDAIEAGGAQSILQPANASASSGH